MPIPTPLPTASVTVTICALLVQKAKLELQGVGVVGECVEERRTGGRLVDGTGRTNDSLKAFVKFIEKIGVGRLCGGDGGELIKASKRVYNVGTRLRTKMVCRVSLTNHESFEILPPTFAIKRLRSPVAMLTLPV
ncbi:ABC transporter permease [Babesia caballi]|uniref:ABC transporter permease n=1 Tax=Babesia caballi TaxID=5871 RepID=A0AAV4LTW3_BABCB|nr:ABC transporter permease [Babesia caballi]